jgi:hypothetical protein
MTTQTNDGKFLRIVSNGFVPLALTPDYNVSHENCHPLLENKSHKDFYNLVADGQIEFYFNQSKREAGKMYLEPVIKLGDSGIYFSDTNNFVVPPVVDAHVENDMLNIKFDLRLDLKALIAPSRMQTFLNLLTSGGITHVGWDYTCTLIKGERKISRRIAHQNIDLYTLQRFKSKKMILEAA